MCRPLESAATSQSAGRTKTRILHVLDHSVPLHSGYSFRTLAIVEQQRARGWETAHVTSAKHPSQVLEESVNGLTFYRTQNARGPMDRVRLLSPLTIIQGLTRRLTQIIPIFRPHILHAHSPCLNGVAALRAGWRFGIPVVYELRALWEDGAVDHGTMRRNGWRYHAARALETYVLRHADAVTTICGGLHAEILARGIPRSRVTMIPNGVDLARFGGDGAAASEPQLPRGLDRTGPVIGYIGSFFGYEGLRLLLEALPAILERRPDSRVLLVGGGPQEDLLRQRAIELGIGGKVVFVGRVPHDDIAAYYDLIDIFVYPRESNRLTDLVTPLKPLEAMARGGLVVASDVGGHRELIRHNETGVLFAAGNAGALAHAVLALVDDVPRSQAIRTAARAFVVAERTWQQSVERYGAVYGQVLTQRRTP